MTDQRLLTIVLDTNVLLVSVSPHSKHHWIYRSLVAGKYELCISNEILTEYQEIIAEKYNPEVADDVTRALLVLPNVRQIMPSYRWNLIAADPDDNKFVDCAIAGNVHGLVTEDRHFNVLRAIDFPAVNLMNMADFKAWLLKAGKSQ